jgi:tetratricopeptide (TPR) repeat protein
MCREAVRPLARSRAAALALAGALALLLSGCGAHFVSRGSSLYQDGHYVEAAEVFEQTERRLDGCSSRERARFGLYRGATYLKLGDTPHAARWLGYARAIESSEPNALNRSDSALLDASLQALGRGGPVEPTRAAGSEVAAAPSGHSAPPQ